jgi:hypothetical protein
MTYQKKLTLEISLIIMISVIWYFSIFLVNNTVWSLSSPLIVSTRDVIDNKTGNALKDLNTAFEDVPTLLGLNANNCPGELAIYIHGVWATPEAAKEQTQRVFLSLQHLKNKIPVIGYSWNSDTAFSLDDEDLSKKGWNIAKLIANKNGPLLAKFILGYKEICPNDEIRLIAHSLGSRVTLSALQSLHDNNKNNIIESVHLLGAAVDDDQISLNPRDCDTNMPPKLKCSGEAINSTTKEFFNLYDEADIMLAPATAGFDEEPNPYKNSENDKALGGFGKEIGIIPPPNYHEKNVENFIPTRFDVDVEDANGDKECDIPFSSFGFKSCFLSFKGDNHMGYMGYRNPSNINKIIDPGAIVVVVDDWRVSNR